MEIADSRLDLAVGRRQLAGDRAALAGRQLQLGPAVEAALDFVELLTTRVQDRVLDFLRKRHRPFPSAGERDRKGLRLAFSDGRVFGLGRNEARLPVRRPRRTGERRRAQLEDEAGRFALQFRMRRELVVDGHALAGLLQEGASRTDHMTRRADKPIGDGTVRRHLLRLLVQRLEAMPAVRPREQHEHQPCIVPVKPHGCIRSQSRGRLLRGQNGACNKCKRRRQHVPCFHGDIIP